MSESNIISHRQFLCKPDQVGGILKASKVNGHAIRQPYHVNSPKETPTTKEERSFQRAPRKSVDISGPAWSCHLHGVSKAV